MEKLLPQQCKADDHNCILGRQLSNGSSAVQLTRLGLDDDAKRDLYSANTAVKHPQQLDKESSKAQKRERHKKAEEAKGYGETHAKRLQQKKYTQHFNLAVSLMVPVPGGYHEPFQGSVEKLAHGESYLR